MTAPETLHLVPSKNNLYTLKYCQHYYNVQSPSLVFHNQLVIIRSGIKSIAGNISPKIRKKFTWTCHHRSYNISRKFRGRMETTLSNWEEHTCLSQWDSSEHLCWALQRSQLQTNNRILALHTDSYGGQHHRFSKGTTGTYIAILLAADSSMLSRDDIKVLCS